MNVVVAENLMYNIFATLAFLSIWQLGFFSKEEIPNIDHPTIVAELMNKNKLSAIYRWHTRCVV